MKQINKKRFMKVIIILGIIILPLIYSLVYLKGFWDPYDNLKDVPIALVNEDACTENCKGSELINKLTEKDTFKYDVVDATKAQDGLVNKKYYAVITIPSNFTESFNDADTKNRAAATITYSPNQKTNYLASQIIGKAMTVVEDEIQSEVTGQVVDGLVGKLNEVPGQTQQISDALGQINTGANSLNTGAAQLKTGANTLNTNYTAFNSGLNQVSTGLNSLQTKYQTLDGGINNTYDSVHNQLLPQATAGITALSAGVGQLKTGSNKLVSTLDAQKYSDTMNSFMTNTDNVYKGIAQICAGNPALSTSAQYAQICQVATGYTKVDPTTGVDGVQALKAGTNGLVKGTNDLNAGINTLSDQTAGITALSAGLTKLDSGLAQLKTGSAQVSAGIGSLASGANTLAINSTKIGSGINTIASATSTLQNGTSELSSGTATAKSTVDAKIADTKTQLTDLDGLSDYTKDSVKVQENDYGQVSTYGEFFAPYFMSLSLWVGGILILIGLYYDPDQRFSVLGRGSKKRVLRLAFYNIIGVIQAIILGFILKASIGFTVTNIFLYYGSCILISITFLAIIMFLFFNFRDLGKFLSIVFLVLQLAACGGTFPIETEPTFYRWLYDFMPMKYSVNLLRESFVQIDGNFVAQNVLILLGIFVVFGVLILVTGYLKGKKEQAKVALRPAKASA